MRPSQLPPGIEAAAVSVVTPISNGVWDSLVTVPGYDAPERERTSLFNRVTPDFFRVMSTPILSGRDIARTDRAGAPKVVLVNEAFAKKFLKGESPLGRTFTIGAPGTPRATNVTIVGLIADAKYRSLRELPQPTMYAAWAQEEVASSAARISMRVSGPPNAFRSTVLSALKTVYKEVVVDFRTLEEELQASTIQERLVATLSAFFGGLALLLAAIGLYGVMSYSVMRRTNEIGVRMALGAEPRRVMVQVLGHVALIIVVGLAAGAGVSLAASRFIDALLFNLVGTDATMLAVAATSLGAAAALAGYLPARRAARVDPMAALREE